MLAAAGVTVMPVSSPRCWGCSHPVPRRSLPGRLQSDGLAAPVPLVIGDGAWQDGLGVAAGDLYGAGPGGIGGAVGIQGREGEGAGCARRDTAGAGDGERWGRTNTTGVTLNTMPMYAPGFGAVVS